MSSNLEITKVINKPVVKTSKDLKYFFRDYFNQEPVNAVLDFSHIESLRVLAKMMKEYRSDIEKMIDLLKPGVVLEVKEIW